MLVTIACVSIFGATLVFFSDEFRAYFQALRARPHIFLFFCLILGSFIVEMNDHYLLLILISFWIEVLTMVQWLSIHVFWFDSSQILAKWLMVMMVGFVPYMLGFLLEREQQKKLLAFDNKIKIRGYFVGLILGEITLLFFVLGLPGSNFSG